MPMPMPTPTPQRVDLTRVNGTSRTRPGKVLIRVPADPDYLVVVRTVVGQLGASLGFTLAEIIDLRLVVDEVCGLLVVGPGGRGELECGIEIGRAGLSLTARAPAAGLADPDPGRFGWAILSALVDSLRWRRDGSAMLVEVEKRRGIRGP